VELLSEDGGEVVGLVVIYFDILYLLVVVVAIFIGITRPNLDPTGCYCDRDCADGWFMGAGYGTLCGNGKSGGDRAGGYEKGDRVGVLLGLSGGSLRFFRNGAQHGPGYAAGSVAGPVVAAVEMINHNESVKLLPNAQQPE
jgi:hypothetical protein